jgi:GNAT superfamily N-acetyltransferase
MEIRLANSSDADAIKAFDEIARIDAPRAAFIDQSIESCQCFVAAVDGRVVAYAVFNYTFYSRGSVAMLLVHRDFRHQGIGSALMQQVAQRCETPELFTSTNQSNTSMQQLLTKLGYEPSGIIHNLDEGDPELVYVKRLRTKGVYRL